MLPRSLVPVLVSCVLVPVAVSESLSRGIRTRAAVEAGIDAYEPANHHALVIGIDRYEHWRKLRCAGSDATEVARVLRESYGYTVTLITDGDATREKIIEAINAYAKLGEEHSLLIYYAGHGWLDDGGRGFWIPVDAREGKIADYVSNSRLVHDYFERFKVRHLLVMSDSCFAGSLLRGQPTPRPGAWRLNKAYTKPSRWIMTSGDLSPVSDGVGHHSPFATRVLQFLGSSDKDAFGVRDLFQYVKESIGEDAEVLAEPLRAQSHMPGGEFVFCRLTPGLPAPHTPRNPLAPQAPSPREERSWWGRNWGWVVGGMLAAGGGVAAVSGGGGGGSAGSSTDSATATGVDVTGTWGLTHRSSGLCTGQITFSPNGTFHSSQTCQSVTSWEQGGSWSYNEQTQTLRYMASWGRDDGSSYGYTVSHAGSVTADTGTFIMVREDQPDYTEEISR